MSENTDKPPTVEPGPVRRNCWTCGWDDRALMRCGPIYEMVPEMDAIERWLYATAGDEDYPPKTADGCPGWKPKPEQANTDRVVPASPVLAAALPPDDRPKPYVHTFPASGGRRAGEKRLALVEDRRGDPEWRNGHRSAQCMDCSEFVTVKMAHDAGMVRPTGATCGCGPFDPELVMSLLSFAQPISEANTDRAQLAALGSVPPPEPTLADLVEALEAMPEETITLKRAEWDALLARIDEIERRQRTDTARFQALRRRDKLRGKR